jgi:hypothetical protein
MRICYLDSHEAGQCCYLVIQKTYYVHYSCFSSICGLFIEFPSHIQLNCLFNFIIVLGMYYCIMYVFFYVYILLYCVVYVLLNCVVLLYGVALSFLSVLG